MKVFGEGQIQFFVTAKQSHTLFMGSTGLTALDKMPFFIHRQAAFVEL